jgi:hypothetical protein
MKTACLIAALLTLPAGLAAHALPASGVLACGGIGADQRAALAERSRGANLQLELFVAQHGDYVGGALVTVTPLAAGAEPLSATADGPICYAQLAPGRYRVEATLHGITRTAQATVRTGKPTHVAIAFPDAAAPGDLDIKPTPEEKQEARMP